MAQRMQANKLLSALLTAALPFIATDANAAEYLAPCSELPKEYYGRVETLIRQVAPDDTLWKVTVYPSFRAEWSIRGVRVGDDYELIVVRFDSPIWPAAVRARSRVSKHKISARLFNALESQLRRSIEAARPNDDLTIDGVTLRFEVAESACGETQTFDEQTQAGKLVAIVLALCNPADEGKIFRMLDELTERVSAPG